MTGTGQAGIETYLSLSPAGTAFALCQWIDGANLRRYQRAGSISPEKYRPNILVVTADSKVAEELLIDLEFFSKKKPKLFTSWELLPFEPLSPTTEIVCNRIAALDFLKSEEEGIIVAPVEALLRRVLHSNLLEAATLNLKIGQLIERGKLISDLDSTGYIRSSLTEELGQISVRGAVIDLFPPANEHPIRLEFFGDVLESIRSFDAESQRSLKSHEEISILPCREHLFPWAVAKYNARENESLEAAVLRVKAAADDAQLPTRETDLLEDVLRTGGTWPGLEQVIPLLQPSLMSIFDYLSSITEIVVIDELGVERAVEQFQELVEERISRSQADGFLVADRTFLSSKELHIEIKKRQTLAFNSLEIAHFDEPSEIKDEGRLEISPPSDLIVAIRRSRQNELPFQPLADEINLRRAQGYEVAIAVSHQPKMRRFQELLDTYGISAFEEKGSFYLWKEEAETRRRGNLSRFPVALFNGSLTGGVRVPRDGIFVISDHEIFPEISLRRPSRSAKQARRILGAANQIREDDFVVHIDHGVALYRGLKQLTVDGKVSDFLQLEYAEGAKLFVPVENIGKVQKYLGAEGKKPALTKLGGKSWSAAKEKVRKNVQELAGQLLNLYAQRELVKGFSFGEQNSDDQLFADTFPYQETADQERAITDVLSDMASDRPMDRLVCGDVGYGKTEVALRAAFKAVNSGKQAALLVPTTVLADQHFNTFRERMGEFGITIGCVSRFNSPAANRKTLEDVSAGTIDIIVGTHRLLQKDVYFANLGLVIIDEEHRFGVADKERLKKLRTDVDVLTLTATPIPRTLHMSLLSIRDLSVIETPPTNRQVIQTYFASYQDSVVREAILREINRSGQVFYIHNRVQNIRGICEELKAVVPEAKIEFAHGQMREDELEEVMHRFVAHEFDVLVSTTIVESGLDIPNANTIIIRESDKLGLAELYQLRGRVGRSSKRAYAYLLVANARTLGPDAKKRLEVLQSLDDLGMGFRLALQDMEIRGAGNLLGKDQSGKIELVGFDLYSRILKEAVRELQARGRNSELSLEPLIDPEVNVGFPAHIPGAFIPDVEERILLYQRLVELRDDSEADELTDEIRDRFGNPPPEVKTLLELMRLKSVLRKAGIIGATRRGLSLSLVFHREAKLDIEKLRSLTDRSGGKLKLAGPSLILGLTLKLETEPDSPVILTEKIRALIQLVT